ncbi:thiamine-phosphate kinase [Tenuifilum thalassicum]|uniref:Thiamine-monophosphate kinase n=1 Tax=Tenuifilum thalassicum TaxID=2590900 RepID=A0A7D3XCI4_9BACT|nr:thiamine-phosphate kinase [Tenuifilum thalassicum]QKG79072.1 thiamine-phosphate kinase [Tenuifilum thalassicum]
MGESKKRTELYELGEFRLIDRITEPFKSPKHNETVFGTGDDAAVISAGNDECYVVTTDLLLEGIHFDLTYFPLKHLGYKSVIVNLSDVYAMNAEPTQITVSIGLSKRFCAEDIDELYSGIKLACDRYNVDLVGGDTSSSMTGLTISVTAIGKAKKDEIVYRSGARVNDLVCVTGNVGAAYMGLQLLEREKRIFESNKTAKPKLEGYDYILERHLKPEARKSVIAALKEAGIKPTSMIDVSDGLSSEILHICKNSNVGCRIYLEKIPIDEQTAKMAEELNIDVHTAALNGGEDYELLFTVPLEKHDAVESIEGVRIVGHIVEPSLGAFLVPPAGEDIKITAQGWNALKKE